MLMPLKVIAVEALFACTASTSTEFMLKMLAVSYAGSTIFWASESI